MQGLYQQVRSELQTPFVAIDVVGCAVGDSRFIQERGSAPRKWRTTTLVGGRQKKAGR